MFASDPDVGPAAAASLTGFFRAARRDSGLAVLEGFHAVKHAVRFGAEVVRVVAAEGADVDGLAAALAPDVGAVVRAAEVVPASVFEGLAPRAPRTGVIAVARRPVVSGASVLAAKGAPCVLLDAPQDLGNVGACVRVAAAAGARGVVTTGGKDPWSPAALRGSAGLHFALPVVRVERCDVPVIALDPDGEPLTADAIGDGAVLAFGTERGGLSREVLASATARLALPMQPGVSSLNLATAVSAVLYAWRLARG